MTVCVRTITMPFGNKLNMVGPFTNEQDLAWFGEHKNEYCLNSSLPDYPLKPMMRAARGLVKDMTGFTTMVFGSEDAPNGLWVGFHDRKHAFAFKRMAYEGVGA